MSKRPLLREMIDPSCLASLLVRMEEMIGPHQPICMEGRV